MAEIEKSSPTVGILGGSGLYELEGLENVQQHVVETTFGSPSDFIVSGFLGEARLLFLPRPRAWTSHCSSSNQLSSKSFGAKTIGCSASD